MKYETLTKDIDRIYEVINLNKRIIGSLQGKDLVIFKESVHKNLTISIYTFWENYCKDLIYQCYSNYKNVIVDKKFLVNYFQHIHEKSFAYKLFLENVEDNKINITRDNLCYSNNLNFKELMALFKRLLFEVDDFKKHVVDFPNLNEAIKNLEACAVYPIFKDEKITHDLFEYFESYLNLIVENRNIVAHQYQLTELYTLNQLEQLLNFIKVVTLVVYEYCGSQLIKKANIKNELIYQRIFPLKVIKGNSKGDSAIVGIRNNLGKIVDDKIKLYCYDKGDKVYRLVDIKTIKNGGHQCKELLPLETYSLEIQTAVKITNKKIFRIYQLSKPTDVYNYHVSV